MRLAIIGSGAIGAPVGTQWAGAGHEVIFSSRHPERLSDLAAEVGPLATVASPADAAASADALLFSVNWWTAREAIEAVGDGIADKVVLDATNPYTWDRDRGLERVIADDSTGIAELVKLAPRARWAKALGHLPAGALREDAGKEPRRAGLFCAEKPDVTVVHALVEDAGYDPVHVGGLDRAREIELGGRLNAQTLTATEARALIDSFET